MPTCNGLETLTVVSTPSSPKLFLPQAYKILGSPGCGVGAGVELGVGVGPVELGLGVGLFVAVGTRMPKPPIKLLKEP